MFTRGVERGMEKKYRKRDVTVKETVISDIEQISNKTVSLFRAEDNHKLV